MTAGLLDAAEPEQAGLDLAVIGAAREECLFELAASGRPLVADLDQVSFIDSTGLAALVGTAKRATACGGSLDEALEALAAARPHPEAPPAPVLARSVRQTYRRSSGPQRSEAAFPAPCHAAEHASAGSGLAGEEYR